MLDHLRRSIALAALGCLGLGGVCVSAAAVATTSAVSAFGLPTAPEPEAWILVDAGTGNVLEGREVHSAKRTASVVKVMTALTAIERLPLTATATITKNDVANGAQNREPSGLAVGQNWSLDQLLHVLLISSANDAAYAIAHQVSGTTANFADAQRSTATRLGLRDSTFNDPSGLDDASSYGGGPRMSAYDIAIATRAALGVPALAKIARTSQYKYTDPGGIKHTVLNHNQLLTKGRFPYADATGFKTGFTKRAGNTLTATATRKGRTLIAVILNTSDTFGWAAKLFDDGFALPVGSPGTGERLPADAFTTIEQRATLQRDFGALVQSPELLQPAATSRATTQSAPTSATKVAGTTGARGTAGTMTKQTLGRNATKTADDSSATPIAIVVIIALIGAFMARREQIKRRKAKRKARQRSTQAALRRGSLPVVDGRYRAGMRTGPPVLSNVKLRRNDKPDDD